MNDYPDITAEWRDVAMEALANTQLAIAQRDEMHEALGSTLAALRYSNAMIAELCDRVDALNAENADLTTRLIGGTA